VIVPDASLYIAAGALVGTLVGLTGVGGGSLMTPLLILAFGQSPSVAVGTDLMFASITKIVATGSFGWSRRVAWPIVKRLALGSLPAAAAVLGILAYTEQRDWHPDRIVVMSLGGLLVLTAATMLLERFLKRAATQGIAAGAHVVERTHPRTTVLVGVGLGIAVTLTSVGAGALGTVALLFLFPRLATDRLVGTDIAHAVPLTLLAGLGHASLGHLDMSILGALLTGSVPAVLIASRVALRLPQRLLRVLLALMLLIVGAKILWVR
jgi:uncharacterized membrane protein YfcA